MCGISDITKKKINTVFEAHKEIECAVLYGSRALGTNRINSDIDITLKGEIKFKELLKVESELDELLLPYKIDLSIYSSIQNEQLIEHIDRVGKIFYKRFQKK